MRLRAGSDTSIVAVEREGSPPVGDCSSRARIARSGDRSVGYDAILGVPPSRTTSLDSAWRTATLAWVLLFDACLPGLPGLVFIVAGGWQVVAWLVVPVVNVRLVVSLARSTVALVGTES